ncbi:phosphoribosylglycinamide formyltransferase [Plantibacter sp. ME-Dv--P-122b]|uniref:phosphoribosylglycinamide formyltransferase n=1 Tax=Plantibacter sp. ME-Dv--P-122b TaxID=3040300 RepID=UPI002551C06A|nr:phosphoribosylglycinamide formyltransferase [Plantibacter sp. ME-Dv--P-122b]
MLSLVVLISGGGSNLRALLEASRDADFPARVIAVGADREADGLAHAEEFGIPSFTVPYSSFDSRAEWGVALLEQIRVWNPDVLVLSGLMRLLPPVVVDALSPRIINTHPAYLPEFPGAHGVRDALAAGAAQTGASIIVVDNGVDAGPIISQERVPVLPDDTEHSLHERIKPVERRLLVQAVRDLATGTIDLEALSTASRPPAEGAPQS